MKIKRSSPIQTYTKEEIELFELAVNEYGKTEEERKKIIEEVEEMIDKKPDFNLSEYTDILFGA